MIELKQYHLAFTFPEVHPDAKLMINFQRTLRIPDDDRDYPLPPGLGPFVLRHVDDYAAKVPPPWIEHGGVMLPIANSLVWRQITGEQPPTVPPTASEYTKAGLPWFEFYDEQLSAVPGSSILEKLKCVVQLGKEKDDVPLPENEPVHATPVIELRRGLKREQVREGRFQRFTAPGGCGSPGRRPARARRAAATRG